MKNTMIYTLEVKLLVFGKGLSWRVVFELFTKTWGVRKNDVILL